MWYECLPSLHFITAFSSRLLELRSHRWHLTNALGSVLIVGMHGRREVGGGGGGGGRAVEGPHPPQRAPPPHVSVPKMSQAQHKIDWGKY